MVKTISEKIVNVRKSHVCFGCGREFPKGTEMRYSFQDDGGGAFGSYLCSTCQKVEEELINQYGYIEYGHGDLRDDALELEKELAEERKDENI